MTIREPVKINPTMKMDAKGENTIPFKETQAVILAVEDVETKFGVNTKLVLENQAEEMMFEVFINNFSMQNLCTAYGKEDKEWIGKIVELKKQTDKKYGKEMIVVHPVK
jgi:hypothetical protein